MDVQTVLASRNAGQVGNNLSRLTMATLMERDVAKDSSSGTLQDSDCVDHFENGGKSTEKL